MPLRFNTMKDILERWLKEVGLRSAQFRFSQQGEIDSQFVTICTPAHTYRLHFSDRYLGAQATCRRVRAGEDWLRGNDLPDGPFCRDTFDRIMLAIVVYEAVELEPVHSYTAESGV